MMQLQSKYSYRMYELLARWGEVGKTEISVDESRWMMGIEEHQYGEFAQLRLRVIDQSIKEINQHTSFKVSVGYRKRGRKVSHIQFEFKRSLKKRLMNDKRSEKQASYDLEYDVRMQKKKQKQKD